MASKDDTALWLHNKLGSSTHLWSFSSTVVSQYSVEKLQLIRDCFVTLDSLVKCKFFLSLFYIPKRNLDEFRPIVQEIIDNTIQTCLDQWVLSIATFVKSYWETQILSTEADYEDLESFREAYTDLRQTLKECVSSEAGIQRTRLLLPIECDYLNMRAKSALLPFSGELFSTTDSFKQHFNLAAKAAKSAAALDDLKYKASHYSKSKTSRVLPSSNILNSYGENTLGGSDTSRAGSYLSRLSSSKKMDSMISNLSDPYSSKIFSNNSNSLNSGSSSFGNRSSNTNSFFKQSSFSSKSSTLTGKSSNIKRDVGIKLLDAQEQSATPQEAKRKRKEQEKEQLKKQKLEQQQQQLIEKEKEKERQMQLKASESAAQKQEAHESSDEGESNKVADAAEEALEPVKAEARESALDDAKPTLLASVENGASSASATAVPAPLEPPSVHYAQQQQQQQAPSISSLNELFNPTAAAAMPPQASLPPQLPQFSLAHGINPSNVSPLAHFNVVRADPLLSSPLTSANNNNNNNSPAKASYAQFLRQHQQNQQQQQQQLANQQHMQQQPHPSMFSGHVPLLSFNTNNPNNNSNNSNNAGMNNNLIKQFNPNYPLFANNSPLSASNLLTSPLMTPSSSAPSEPSLAEQAQHLHLQQQQQQQQQQPAAQPQKSLSLTREQMLQAQEMFSNSNRLTRPEKALILGFIAGSRENPHPEHGPLISIKLNEAEEILTINNGQQHRVLSEIFFQMNYDTGEYKRIKKIKPIGMPLGNN